MARTEQGEFERVKYAVPGGNSEISNLFGSLTPVLLGSASGGSFGFGGSAGIASRAGLRASAVTRCRNLANLSGEIRTTMTVAGHSSSRGYITAGSIRYAVRFGRRTPDPGGVAGAHRYEVPAYMNAVVE